MNLVYFSWTFYKNVKIYFILLLYLHKDTQSNNADYEIFL